MSATGTQIETLMDFMMKNPDLARGLIHSVEGRVQSKRLWDNITSHLNSLGGAVKTVQQWKKRFDLPLALVVGHQQLAYYPRTI
ncbi:unnamed protein product [Leptidea sinapis]|uniref:Regulatory protein zeste n=1 Tax=Leptidea sinapis TaxID=189913 RepID=A0A5E4QCU2_9NEOP|nr:unnamed protein product [Leptidea sinapis]